MHNNHIILKKYFKLVADSIVIEKNILSKENISQLHQKHIVKVQNYFECQEFVYSTAFYNKKNQSWKNI